MMQTEGRYDDLTAMFEAQDEKLQSEAFVGRVMRPVRKRSRWRSPLLFGAGGIGIGAALSQLGGLLDLASARTLALNVSFDQVQLTTWQWSTVDPLWVAGGLVVLISCLTIFVSERA